MATLTRWCTDRGLNCCEVQSNCYCPCSLLVGVHLLPFCIRGIRAPQTESLLSVYILKVTCSYCHMIIVVVFHWTAYWQNTDIKGHCISWHAICEFVITVKLLSYSIIFLWFQLNEYSQDPVMGEYLCIGDYICLYCEETEGYVFSEQSKYVSV